MALTALRSVDLRPRSRRSATPGRSRAIMTASTASAKAYASAESERRRQSHGGHGDRHHVDHQQYGRYHFQQERRGHRRLLEGRAHGTVDGATTALRRAGPRPPPRRSPTLQRSRATMTASTARRRPMRGYGSYTAASNESEAVRSGGTAIAGTLITNNTGGTISSKQRRGHRRLLVCQGPMGWRRLLPAVGGQEPTASTTITNFAPITSYSDGIYGVAKAYANGLCAQRRQALPRVARRSRSRVITNNTGGTIFSTQRRGHRRLLEGQGHCFRQ